jgi:hypothetical protein
VDIYIWDATFYPQMHKRYVIMDGYCMPYMQEQSYLSYIRNSRFVINNRTLKVFNTGVIKAFPKWNYLDYTDELRCEAFEHVYYASHRSGPKEILYKAGLFRLAYHIYGVPNFNMMGSNPCNIFGEGLPIRLLRIMNQKYFLFDYYHIDDINVCKEVYKIYGGYIGDELPNRCQWIYLTRLYRNKGKIGGYGFLRSIYNRLALTDNEWAIDRYEEFLLLRSKTPKLRHLKIPKTDDVLDIVSNLEYLVSVKEDMHCDEMIRMRKNTENYAYIGKKFSVIMPECAEDFFIEEEILGIWVLDELERHANQQTTILFLRKNDKLKTPFVMLEISMDMIYHAYAHLYIPPDDVYTFLEEYAKAKNLKYDKQMLIDDANWYYRFG